MKRCRTLTLLSVFLGAAGFFLRLLQNKTGFDVDGLPISGNLPALALPLLLLLSGAALLLAVRPLEKGPLRRSFFQCFSGENAPLLTLAVLGIFLMAASGVLEIAFALSPQEQSILSADGMSVLVRSAGTVRSELIMGALSVIAAASLFPGAAACRRPLSPLPILAAPVCLLIRLIFTYRLYSVDPVLAHYYPELLGLILLILGTYRLSGFAVQAGSPRIFTAYAALTAILALTLPADGITPVSLLLLGGAAALTAFALMYAPDEEM